ncbi:MAG: methyltransferase [Halobacteriovoraceae bacterium]|nr:methyltransferase [Halobacteriovoraceae bacterium]
MFDFTKNIQPRPRVAELCKEFVAKAKTRPKFILGINDYTKDIISKVKVDGVIDDFSSEKTVGSVPIFRTKNVPKDALVVSTVVGNLLSAEKVLKSNELEYINYPELTLYSPIEFKGIYFWHGFHEGFDKNKKKFLKICDRLADHKSKEIFKDLIRFRLTGDSKYHTNFFENQNNQYFEDFLKLSDDEVFIDVGGYTGDTSEEFIKRVQSYSFIHLFEPEIKNLNAARERLCEKNNIKYYPLGLSNKKQTLMFSTNGSASRISPEGNIKIKSDRLDDVIKTPFTFLKMDIEGGEKEALEGARQLIKNHSPKLAISVYHKGNDLWAIPEQVLSYQENYNVYLRHYTEGVVETVMFFVPR